MPQEIIVIDLGGVNCYLVKTAPGYILIDTGYAAKRADLEKALAQAGCRPGSLPLHLREWALWITLSSAAPWIAGSARSYRPTGPPTRGG